MPGRKKQGAPVHQNSTKYVHMRHCKENRLPDAAYSTMYSGMCTKCRGIMDWKKTYGKWKAMSQPGVCGSCKERTVTNPFARLCQKCVHRTKRCAHCHKIPEPDDILGSYPLSHSDQQRLNTQKEKEMSTMRERTKRRLRRGTESDSDSDSDFSDNHRAPQKEKRPHEGAPDEAGVGGEELDSSDIEEGSEGDEEAEEGEEASSKGDVLPEQEEREEEEGDEAASETSEPSEQQVPAAADPFIASLEVKPDLRPGELAALAARQAAALAQSKSTEDEDEDSDEIIE